MNYTDVNNSDDSISWLHCDNFSMNLVSLLTTIKRKNPRNVLQWQEDAIQGLKILWLFTSQLKKCNYVLTSVLQNNENETEV